jgi:hypothetical protein
MLAIRARWDSFSGLGEIDDSSLPDIRPTREISSRIRSTAVVLQYETMALRRPRQDAGATADLGRAPRCRLGRDHLTSDHAMIAPTDMIIAILAGSSQGPRRSTATPAARRASSPFQRPAGSLQEANSIGCASRLDRGNRNLARLTRRE